MNITKFDLTSLLKKHIVEIKFIKKDGTERLMECTLLEDVVPNYEKKTERVRKPNDNILSVWDIQKDQFRSFKLDSLLSYSVLKEGYEL